jgi:hypothetical protein
MRWNEVTVKLRPNEVILLIDIQRLWAPYCLYFIAFALVVCELLSITLVYIVLSFLRKNSAMFSKSTYRLHVQFTILLAVQVNILAMSLESILYPVIKKVILISENIFGILWKEYLFLEN